MKKLYVGNLSYDVTDEDLRDLFAQHGEVVSAKIITDKFDKSSKGFGFVEFANDSEADNAVSTLDGQDFKGRNLKVNEARERTEGGGGGSRGGYGGGGGGGRRDGGRGGFGGGGGRRDGGGGYGGGRRDGGGGGRRDGGGRDRDRDGGGGNRW